MVSKTLAVINKMGFHMRPASLFVGAMAKYPDTDIRILHNGREIDGKSIMNLMAACIKYGAEIEIRCSGNQEQALLAEAVSLVENKLGDSD